MNMSKIDYDIRPTPMPDWLSADTSQSLPAYPTTPEDRLLQQTIYLSLFETSLDAICEGIDLQQFINRDPRGINYGKFVRWILKDPERKSRYYEAQAIMAEILMSRASLASMGELNENGIPNEVPRDTLIVNTAKWMMGVYNRQRFGDIKQVDINSTTTVNVRSLLEVREAKLAQLTSIKGEIIDVE